MKTSAPPSRPAARGFTLLELMITLAVAAVLATVAIPNMRDFMRNNRLTAAANDLLRSIQVSRSEAIKRQARVVVCSSSDPLAVDPDCGEGTFNGWVVFEDGNNNWEHDSTETIIERHGLLDASLTVLTDNDGKVSFNQSGFANPTEGSNDPTRTIVIHDDRGVQQVGNNATARALLIEATGRARVEGSYAKICEKFAAEFSGSCTSGS